MRTRTKALLLVLAGLLIAREVVGSSGPRFVDLYTAQTKAGALTLSDTLTPNSSLDLAGASSTIINSGVENGGSVPFSDALRSLVTGAAGMTFESSIAVTGGVDTAYLFKPAATFTTGVDKIMEWQTSAGVIAAYMIVGGELVLNGTGTGGALSLVGTHASRQPSVTTVKSDSGRNLYMASAADAVGEYGSICGSTAIGLAASAPGLQLCAAAIDIDGSPTYPFTVYAGGGILIDGTIGDPTSVSSGSGTAAVAAATITGQAGGACTTASGTVAGGEAGDWTTTLSTGGAASGASTQNTGGRGGDWALTLGAGGNATNATTNIGGAPGGASITQGIVGTGSTSNGVPPPVLFLDTTAAVVANTKLFSVRDATVDVFNVDKEGDLQCDGNIAATGTIAGSNLSATFTGADASAVTGTYKVLGASAVAVTAPGDTAENVLATITVPANAMGANGILRIWASWSITNNANNKTIIVRFSGASGTAYLSVTQNNLASYGTLTSITNRGATNSQVGGINNGTSAGLGAAGGTLPTSAVDTTASTTVVLACTKASGGDTCTLERYLVELIAP